MVRTYVPGTGSLFSIVYGFPFFEWTAGKTIRYGTLFLSIKVWEIGELAAHALKFLNMLGMIKLAINRLKWRQNRIQNKWDKTFPHP